MYSFQRVAVAMLLLAVCGPVISQTTVFFNEIHYDNAGGDVGEALEVAGPAGTDLTDWSVVRYNGNGGGTYGTTVLNGALPDSCSGLGITVINYPANGLQNGDPDGMALVDNLGAVVQFLSYEGQMTATNGPANGLTSDDIGVSETGSGPIGDSLQLTGAGTTYEDFTWATTQPGTFGNCNTGQSFIGGADVPPQVISTDPSNLGIGVALDTDVALNFTESVNLTANAFDISCTTSGTVSFTPSVALPTAAPVTTISLNPDVDLVIMETCTVTVSADEVSDVDGMTMNTLDGDGDGISEGSTTDDFVFSFSTPQVQEIFEIQGGGMSSPFAGVNVIASDNIVTAVSTDGFFIQTPDARDDADITTSNGMYVFTGAVPTVVVGDNVEVIGQVVEFFERTEFTNGPVVSINSSGNPLPAAVIFDAVTPSPNPATPSCNLGSGDPKIDNFECYENMRIQVTGGSIGSGNQSFGGGNPDPTAESFITADQRPFRETGIQLSQSMEPGLPPGLPIWDENPELFELDPDKLGLPNLNMTGDSTFDASGILTFDFGDYELWPNSLTITENTLPKPVSGPQSGALPVYTVGSINVLRLFNDVDDPGPEDNGAVEDPVVYAARLSRFSRYIREVLLAPDLIALQEVENIDVLIDLAAQLTTDDPTLAYTAELVEGNDVGGIDVGYLYNARVTGVTVTQHGAAETLTLDGSLLHDRPPLQLRATLADGPDNLEINALVVHNRSLGGITDSNPVNANRVRQKRLEQAVSVANIVTNIDVPTVPLVVLGDFNAFQFTDSYVDVIGEIDGTVVPADNERSSGSATVPLTNVVGTLAPDQQYSFVFFGNAQVLDHALLNDAALGVFSGMQYGRGNADGAEEFEESLTSEIRVSDHDGFVLFLSNLGLLFKDSFEGSNP